MNWSVKKFSRFIAQIKLKSTEIRENNILQAVAIKICHQRGIGTGGRNFTKRISHQSALAFVPINQIFASEDDFRQPIMIQIVNDQRINKYRARIRVNHR